MRGEQVNAELKQTMIQSALQVRKVNNKMRDEELCATWAPEPNDEHLFVEVGHQLLRKV